MGLQTSNEREEMAKIRIWKLGIYNPVSPAHSIIPTKEAVIALENKLKQWDGHSDLDIVGGPELDMQMMDDATSGPDVDRIIVVSEPEEKSVATKTDVVVRSFDCRNENQFYHVMEHGLQDDMRTFNVKYQVGFFDVPGKYKVVDFIESGIRLIKHDC